MVALSLGARGTREGENRGPAQRNVQRCMAATRRAHAKLTGPSIPAGSTSSPNSRQMRCLAGRWPRSTASAAGALPSTSGWGGAEAAPSSRQGGHGSRPSLQERSDRVHGRGGRDGRGGCEKSVGRGRPPGRAPSPARRRRQHWPAGIPDHTFEDDSKLPAVAEGQRQPTGRQAWELPGSPPDGQQRAAAGRTGADHGGGTIMVDGMTVDSCRRLGSPSRWSVQSPR